MTSASSTAAAGVSTRGCRGRRPRLPAAARSPHPLGHVRTPVPGAVRPARRLGSRPGRDPRAAIGRTRSVDADHDATAGDGAGPPGLAPRPAGRAHARHADAAAAHGHYGPKVTTASGYLGVSATRGEIWTPGSEAKGSAIWTPGSEAARAQGAGARSRGSLFRVERRPKGLIASFSMRKTAHGCHFDTRRDPGPRPRGMEPPDVPASSRGLGDLAAGPAARPRIGGRPAGPRDARVGLGSAPGGTPGLSLPQAGRRVPAGRVGPGAPQRRQRRARRRRGRLRAADPRDARRRRGLVQQGPLPCLAGAGSPRHRVPGRGGEAGGRQAPRQGRGSLDTRRGPPPGRRRREPLR